jgi:hypothetical protein
MLLEELARVQQLRAAVCKRTSMQQRLVCKRGCCCKAIVCGDTRLGARACLDATALDDDGAAIAMLATLLDVLAMGAAIARNA